MRSAKRFERDPFVDEMGRWREEARRAALRRRAIWGVVAFAVGFWVFAWLVLHAFAAEAAPPPKGSDDWNVMAPFKEWVTSQHDAAGRWCCDIADGRPVDAEIRGGNWWAHIDPKHWAGEPDRQDHPGPPMAAPVPLTDRWVIVPDEKVTRAPNPTGAPILWLYQGRVQCFSPVGLY